MVGSLKDVFSELKVDLIKAIETSVKENEFKPVTRFADAVKNKTKPVIIIEPKNVQNSVKTKTDIESNIDPAIDDLQISKVITTKNGGMLVGCLSTEQTYRFKQIAETKLADSYNICEAKGLCPQVKIVGFQEMYQEDEFLELTDRIKKGNNSSFTPTPNVKY
ncbi:hypothetical protein Zmor_001581 [Zophobas morio]|uniref:Uncharacterized protein n=1 Tax=Zophobas morio TaxID=2755281 RepID=A0AA38MSW1_9CUCU|nr:hypothetical protein Zmor_001581 [Zophobas morio]